MTARVIPALALVLTAAGCDAGPRRLDVAGTVTFAGRPVRYAHIYFDPDASKGNNGPQGFAEVIDGAYATAKKGRGGPVGAVVVRIEGHGPPSPGVPDGVPFQDFRATADLAPGGTYDFDVPKSFAVKPSKSTGPVEAP